MHGQVFLPFSMNSGMLTFVSACSWCPERCLRTCNGVPVIRLVVKQRTVSGGLGARQPIGGLVVNDTYARGGAGRAFEPYMLLPW